MTALCLSYFQCAQLFSGILCLWMNFCWWCAFSKTLLRECAVLFVLFQSSEPLKGCINDRDITESFYWLCFWAQHKAPHCWLLCLIIKVSSSHLKQFLISVVADQQLVLLRARPLITPPPSPHPLLCELQKSLSVTHKTNTLMTSFPAQLQFAHKGTFWTLICGSIQSCFFYLFFFFYILKLFNSQYWMEFVQSYFMVAIFSVQRPETSPTIMWCGSVNA